MSFNLRPGTSLFGNITFTPGTNENYVAPTTHGSVNVALTATSTASTHISDRQPSLAHDGIIGISDTDGSTISNLNAWVTTGEGVGAWMQLDWSTPQTVNKIKLYDRPNVTHDHIKGGTLTFSDGSSVTVGELPDGVVNGAPDPLEVTFDAKTITWVRFTVDAFTGHNAGLTEFEVWSVLAAPEPESGPEPEAVVIDNSSKVTMLLDASVSGDDTVVDFSPNAHSVTINGDVSQSSFSPYRSGGYSQEFSTGYISKTADDDSFNFGSDDFTVEMWFNAGPQAANFPGLFSGSNYNVAGSASFRFDNINYDQKVWLYINGVGDPAIVTTNTYAYYQWHHTALVRNGTNLSIYVNGVQDASITISASQNINFDAGEFRMGRGFDVDGGNAYFNGKIAGVRAVRGTAVYTSNFTVPTSSPTDIAGTELLTCHLPYVVDGSSNNHGLTLNGGVSSAGSTPYDRTGYSESLHGGSYVFDGSSRLTLSSQMHVSGEFAIESWVYPITIGNDDNTDQFLCGTLDGSNVQILRIKNGYAYFTHRSYQSFSDVVGTLDDGGLRGNTLLEAGQWYHLALTRDTNDKLRIFVNGQLDAEATWSHGFNFNTIGALSASVGHLQGHMADFRVVLNSPVYTTDFTPPTAPLTAVTGTSLLLAGTNASYRDQTQGVKSMSMEGNVAVESSSPFAGQRSLTFDGSGDRVVMESDALAFGTGDYTVEGWAYLDSVGYYKIIITTRPNNGAYADAFSVQVDNSTGKILLYSNAFDIKSPSSVPVGQWFHYAVTRENSLTRMFLDGVEVASATIAKNYTRTLVGVGDFPVTMSEPWVGEIGEIRVTKGLARYTSDFTVPTGPLGQYTEAPNVAPTISGIDASYDLSSGMDTVITGVATDLHNDPITWTYAVTSGSLGDTTVTQADNVFTVTPGTADATFQLTFTATDDNGNAATFVSDITHVYVEPTYVQSGLVFNLDATNYSGSGNWIDLTGNGGDATLTNGMSFDAANGGSFAIDGADDFAQFPSTALVGGNGAFTNEFWFKWSGASGPQVIFGYGNDTGPNAVNVSTVTNNKFRFEFGSGAGIADSTTTINTGTWYHAAVAYDQSSVKVYINGVLEATTAHSSANVPLSGYGGENGSIGALFSTWGNVSANGTRRYGTFGGNVAVVRQYNRALNGTEIQFNYDASKDRY